MTEKELGCMTKNYEVEVTRIKNYENISKKLACKIT